MQRGDIVGKEKSPLSPLYKRGEPDEIYKREAS
jgi:hypothetical protein